MDDIIFVGLNVHKATVNVAIAEGGRGGEVRQVGVFENRPDVLVKMATRLARGGRQLNFCYEAGPCGYGLHRLLTGSGQPTPTSAVKDTLPGIVPTIKVAMTPFASKLVRRMQGRRS